MEENKAPAGWYPIDGDGDNVRYWDGQKWLVSVTDFERAGVITRARKPVNKTLHLVLTIVTLGLWMPIWTIILLTRISDELD